MSNSDKFSKSKNFKAKFSSKRQERREKKKIKDRELKKFNRTLNRL